MEMQTVAMACEGIEIVLYIEEERGGSVTKGLDPDVAISFQDVYFSYDAETLVLRGVNLTIPKGQKVVVVGLSGSGKSTLVKLIMNFYQPQKGKSYITSIIGRMDVVNNDHGYINPISLSIAPTNVAIGRQYSDLIGSIDLMKRMQVKGVTDGFEFQCLEEWDEDGPPLDEQEKRLDIWRNSHKYSTHDIISLLEESEIEILSVHAKRDIGIYLCSDRFDDVEEGIRLIDETLDFASKIGSSICVFHLWDTWKEDFDLAFIRKIFSQISSQYPNIKACVENIPTHLKGHTPYDIVKDFRFITLDLQWAALYDEFEKFIKVKHKIANIHLRGELQNSKWIMKNSPFSFYEGLDVIRDLWAYKGVLTMEPNGLMEGDLEELIIAMESLK